jgi:hypothetical protein
MLGADVARGGLAAAGALVVAVLVGAIPAQGAGNGPTAPAGAAGPTSGTPTDTTTGSPSPSPTETPTETPTPTPTPTPTTTTPPVPGLLPDLIALPANQLSVQVRKDGRRLRFASSLGNTGVGPIEVRPNNLLPCPEGQHNSTQIIYVDGNANGRYNRKKDTGFVRHRAGCMIYHPLHHHWHFKASARYTLRSPVAEGQTEGVVVSARRKVSFCLRDTARVPARYGEFGYDLAYGRCTKRSPQGISIGWMDVYQSFLAGQALRLPDDLPNGLYCLETVVDPIDQLVETNNDNNSSVRALRIHGTKVVERPTARCR